MGAVVERGRGRVGRLLLGMPARELGAARACLLQQRSLDAETPAPCRASSSHEQQEFGRIGPG